MSAVPDQLQEELLFTISRVFDAPRELVWEAWTQPKHMSQWWGPREFTNSTCEMDVRPGGAYRFVMRSPDGIEYPITGVYHEVVRPERLVFTMDCKEHPESWHDLVNPQRRPEEKNPAGVLLATVTFEEINGQTKVNVRVRFDSTSIRDAMLKMGMTEGWSQSLDRLTEELSRK